VRPLGEGAGPNPGRERPGDSAEIYSVEIAVEPLPPDRWEAVRKRCAGRIGSLLELLEGRFSENVMAVVADRETGLFPRSGEIDFECSCPDWAVMCKHVAAVFYGVGARLDEEPELLFRLRGVDPEALIGVEADLTAAEARGGRRRIAEDALGDVFGIEVGPEAEASSGVEPDSGAAPAKSAKTAKTAGKRAVSAKPSKAAGKTAKAAKSSKPTAKKSAPAKPSKPVVRRPAAGKSSKVEKKATTRPADKGKDRSVAPDLPPTGEAVARLRADFDMTQAEFAKLLGVSVGSVCNWEKKRGPLELQARSRAAWDAASRLTKKQAWRELDWE
jgi:uncharacterized Zn finger protein